MEHDGSEGEEMHPMDAVHPDNVQNVYAIDDPWQIPRLIIELEADGCPEYVGQGLTEVQDVYGYKTPKGVAEKTQFLIQIR
jgi:hypothetical protein